MDRVRSAKAVHVPVSVPAPLAPVLLSRDERQQLRVAKHRAFQRHQQNAMWTRSIFEFDGVTHRLSSSSSSDNANEGGGASYENRTVDASSDSDTSARTQQQQQHASDEARLLDQLDAKAREIAAAKQQIARFEHEQRENQERFEALIAGLKSIADSAALASFHERVQQEERVRLLRTPAREPEVVKL